MGRIVELDEHELRVRFSGVTAFRARRLTLRVPRTAIRSVTTRPFDPEKRTPGRRYFRSYDDPRQTMTVELDRSEAGFRYDVLVLGVDEARATPIT